MLNIFKLLDQITWTRFFDLLVLVFALFGLLTDSSRVYLIIVVTRFDLIIPLFLEFWLVQLLSSVRKTFGRGLVITTAFLGNGVLLLGSMRIWLFWGCSDQKQWGRLYIRAIFQHRFFIVTFDHIWLRPYLMHHLWRRWFDLFFTQTNCAFLLASYLLLLQSTDGLVYSIPLKGLDKLAFNFLYDLPPGWLISVFFCTAWSFATHTTQMMVLKWVVLGFLSTPSCLCNAIRNIFGCSFIRLFKGVHV